MKLLLVAALLGLFLSVPSLAQDPGSSEMLYQGLCRNCHGANGMGLASFPKIAGKDAAYISMRLNQYRAGEMVGYNSPLMWPNASELSDEEIAGLAEYIATEFN